jgi:L-alanine-DL-glutamate epimerase-like enolase superfamily enzyme
MNLNRRDFLKAASCAGVAAMGLAINPCKAWSRPSNLRITDIRGCTVASNYDYPIIKLYTNQDIYGLGEVRDAGTLNMALVLKPLLVGKDPLDIEGILASIREWSGGDANLNGRNGGGFSAIDMALFDIAGKALGVPAYKILGAKLRDKIEIYADTDENLDKTVYAKRAKIRVQNFGLKWMKMDLRPQLFQGVEGATANGLPTEKGIEIWGEYVEAVREAIGMNIPLGADHFGNMNVETGIMLGKAMAKPSRKLAYIEDVIGYSRPNAVEWMKQITANSPTPTLGYEDLFGLNNYRPFLMENAVSLIHCDMETSGGLMETHKISMYASRFGIKTMFHHAGSPVGAMASVHCACTLPDFMAIENHAFDIPWWQDLVKGIDKPLIKDGCYTVPEKPGLGIELDDEVVQKYLREAQYVSKTGYFEPTPEFDAPTANLADARAKGMLTNRGGMRSGPWIHLDENGELVNTVGPR